MMKDNKKQKEASLKNTIATEVISVNGMEDACHDAFQKLIQDLKPDLNPSYTGMIDRYEEQASTVKFANSSLKHALYIICKMFEHAKEDICILSGSLDELYIGTIQNLIKIFAGRLKSIKIITLKEKDTRRIIAFRDYIREFNEKENAKIVDYIALDDKGDPKKIGHYNVVDGKAWRKEEPHNIEYKDNDIRADVCFNNQKEGKLLANHFIKLWKRFASHSLA